jgi:hypothetical protein
MAQRSPREHAKQVKTERNQGNGVAKTASSDNVSFISQIKEIYRVGSVLTDFSDRLIHKIDCTTLAFDRKYK